MDIVEGAVIYLLSRANILAITDLGGDSTYPKFIFQNKYYRNIEGSGKAAIRIQRSGNWLEPNLHNTEKFPRLTLSMLCDPTRDANKNIIAEDADKKAMAIWEVVNKELEFYSDSRVWGTVRVHDCHRNTEPSPQPLFEGDGVVLLTCYYGIKTD